MPYTELIQRVADETPATLQEISSLLAEPTAQTFAIVDAASSLRYRFFQNKVTALATGEATGEKTVLEIAPDLNSDDIAADIARSAGATGTLEIDFLAMEGYRPLPAMTALRIIAVARIAAPEATLLLGEGRAQTLNSLQALALHVANGVVLADRDDSSGLALLADLQILSDGNFKVLGAEDRDLVAEHEAYMREAGYEVPLAETSSGCGGSCACGSGGCGA